MATPLTQRHEILFLYDVKMTNPNGDTSANEPRTLPDGTVYITDVRLKRFIRDYIEERYHQHIFVSKKAPPRTAGDAFQEWCKATGKNVSKNKYKEEDLKNLLSAMLEAHIDLRWFGSVFAFNDENETLPNFRPHTGPVQFSIGEVLHPTDTIFIPGTSIFTSTSNKTQGTFTDMSVIRYGLIGFSGTVNQHNAAMTQMSDDDYHQLLEALWYGVALSNTRSKQGQIPRLLISVDFPEGSEQYIGRLQDQVTLDPNNPKIPETQWASPKDYTVNLQKLTSLLQTLKPQPTIRSIQHPQLAVSNQPETMLPLHITPARSR